MRAGRAPWSLAQTENVCGRITARVIHYHDSSIRWAREHFLVSLLKISHQKELFHGYYRMGGHEISTSRSLDMIGKISLVMWLHFNQSCSKNLSMWDIKNNTYSLCDHAFIPSSASCAACINYCYCNIGFARYVRRACMRMQRQRNSYSYMLYHRRARSVRVTNLHTANHIYTRFTANEHDSVMITRWPYATSYFNDN